MFRVHGPIFKGQGFRVQVHGHSVLRDTPVEAWKPSAVTTNGAGRCASRAIDPTAAPTGSHPSVSTTRFTPCSLIMAASSKDVACFGNIRTPPCESSQIDDIESPLPRFGSNFSQAKHVTEERLLSCLQITSLSRPLKAEIPADSNSDRKTRRT